MHRHLFNLRIFSQSKMNSDVVRAQIARVRMSTAQKFSPPLPEFHFSPNSEAISVDGLQSNQEPVVAVQETALVQQEPYSTVVIRDHDVYSTIVIDVAECRTATYL
jgi:hypothetical protein